MVIKVSLSSASFNNIAVFSHKPIAFKYSIPLQHYIITHIGFDGNKAIKNYDLGFVQSVKPIGYVNVYAAQEGCAWSLMY